MAWKKFTSLTAIIWLFVAALALHAFCWPLAQNLWAYYHWERVPCKIHDRGGYTFLYRNKAYIATRIDFWDRSGTYASETAVIAPYYDRTCYIAPGHPSNSVLNLDAQRHPERALRYLDRVLLAAFVAAILTYAIRRTSKPPPTKPTPSSGSEKP